MLMAVPDNKLVVPIVSRLLCSLCVYTYIYTYVHARTHRYTYTQSRYSHVNDEMRRRDARARGSSERVRAVWRMGREREGGRETKGVRGGEGKGESEV